MAAETRTSPHEEVDSDVTGVGDVIACFDFDVDVTRGAWRKERGKLYQNTLILVDFLLVRGDPALTQPPCRQT